MATIDFPDYMSEETRALMRKGEGWLEESGIKSRGLENLETLLVWTMLILHHYVVSKHMCAVHGVQPPEDYLRFIDEKEKALSAEEQFVINAIRRSIRQGDGDAKDAN